MAALLNAFPPQRIFVPGIVSKSAWQWERKRSVVTVKTGPRVKSTRERRAARVRSLDSSPACCQFSWAKRMDCAEHFCPVWGGRRARGREGGTEEDTGSEQTKRGGGSTDRKRKRKEKRKGGK
jgi:hypothetical protein